MHIGDNEFQIWNVYPYFGTLHPYVMQFSILTLQDCNHNILVVLLRACSSLSFTESMKFRFPIQFYKIIWVFQRSLPVTMKLDTFCRN